MENKSGLLRMKAFKVFTSILEVTTGKATPWHSQSLRLGAFLILLSAVVFVASIHTVQSDDANALFIINYGFFLLYGIITYLKRRDDAQMDPRIKTSMLYYCAALGFISCFALNRMVNVFEGSAPWLDYLIIVFISVCLLRPYVDYVNSFLSFLYHLIMGVCLLLLTYYAVCLTLTYIMAFFGILLFGIGIHSFMPLLIGILIVVDGIKKDRVAQKGLILGYTLSVVALGIGLWYVAGRIENINRLGNGEAMNRNGHLPTWVTVAQQLDDDYLNFHILKAESNRVNLFNDWGVGRFRGEKKTHDPLVIIASYFTPTLNLSSDDKVRVLEALSANSNVSESRLWQGEDLKTTFVGTQVRLHTSERLAYTEKLFTIRNTKKRGSQETVYTLQMPEGAIVTALSLWVNGKEEKGVLTSKEKAQTAYNHIVGYERRDPSMVLWKEGNQVSIRVFPCNYREDRKVKLGIVAPLSLQGNQLVYQTMGIIGTDLSECEERIQVGIDQSPADMVLPSGFHKEGNLWIREAPLDMDFKLNVLCKPLIERVFSHEGYTYTLKPFQKEYQPKNYKCLYLDLNRTWEKDEIRSVLATNLDKCVYYCDLNQELVQITNSNLEEVYDFAQNNIYSLFPFYVIKDLETALVVTKSGKQSPNLKTLFDTEFGNQLKNRILSNKFDVFNLSYTNSLYLGSLKQFECINMDFGSVEDLKRLVEGQKFLKPTYALPNQAVLDQNGTCIQRSIASAVTNSGSDFLARLFIAQKSTAAYLPVFLQADTSMALINDLVHQGQIANVVTPTTSLIVLETKEDYETHHIKNQTNTLGNTSVFKKQDAGAAPEPHEWALILICSATLLYFQKARLQQWYVSSLLYRKR